MSKHWILVSVLISGVIIAVLFYQGKEVGPLMDLTEALSADASGAQSQSPDNSSVASSLKSFRMVAPTSSSSANQSFEGRMKRSASSVSRNGSKSFNASGAKWSEDPLLVGTKWKIWSGVTAYPKSAGEPTSGHLLGEINGYYLVDEDFKANSENFDGKPFVVIEPLHNSVGVVTGTVGVNLEVGASADFLTQDENIKVLASFPDIGAYYVTSAQVPFNLRTFQENLRFQPEVKEVKLEILSRQHEKF